MQLPDGQTTCWYRSKTSRWWLARGAAAFVAPALAMGWPQQVWASGYSTFTPSRSSTRAVARPTAG